MSLAPRLVAILAATALLAAACGGPAAAPSPSASPTASPAAKARLYVLSNSSPHISVIDAETRQVVRKTDLPNFTSWTWNDDNNYFDGKNLWLGLRNPTTNDAEVIALDLDSLEITSRIAVGQEKLTLYISKATRDGILPVAKMGAAQIVGLDTKAAKVLWTRDVPVNGGVVCDIDVHVGPDGTERITYPTYKGDTVVTIDPKTGATLKSVDHPKGSSPWMNTLSPDGQLWVQEGDANTNAVLDPVTLAVIKRIPTGKSPTNVSFSPDGRLAYITHLADTIVQVVNARTFEEVQRVEVGTNPWEVGVHPNGKTVFAIVTKEAAVAVIDTATWKVTDRIPLGTNPAGIFLRQMP